MHLTLFSLVSILAVALSSIVYDGKTSILELTDQKPFKITLFNVTDGVIGEPVASLDLPRNATSVVGTRVDLGPKLVHHHLQIQFEDQNITGDNVALDTVTMTFLISSNLNESKWTLIESTVTHIGKVHNSSINSTTNLEVTPNGGGTTPFKADRICSKGYTLCAPKNLCWTCNDQEFWPLLSNRTKDGDIVAKLNIPGMKLQPFFGNSTRFGFNWDCDPLLTIGTWVGLLLSLFFILLITWALQYITSIGQVTRFDEKTDGSPLYMATDN